MRRSEAFFIVGVVAAIGLLGIIAQHGGITGHVIMDTGFPRPYIVDGALAADVVVGANAASSDALAAQRLVRAFSSTVTEQQPASVEAIARAESFLIADGSDFLEASEYLADVIPIVDKEFALLADGTLTLADGEFAYHQFLEMPTGMGGFFEVADDIPDDPSETPALFLKLAKDTVAYTYVLEFVEPVVADVAALEEQELLLLGDTLHIVEATAGGNALSLTMMGGDYVASIEEGETIVIEIDGVEYEITAEIIDVNTEEVKFLVNGEALNSLGEGGTELLSDGRELGVLDVLVNQRGGMVRFILDNQRVLLDDRSLSGSETNRLVVNGEGIQGSDVQIEGSVSGSTVTIERIEISWTPRHDYFLFFGQRLSELLEEDALFTGNWDILYEGIVMGAPEQIALAPRGRDEYQLIFPNTAGHVLMVPLFYDGTRYGTDDEPLVVDEGSPIPPDGYFLVTSDGSEGRFSANGQTHLLRYQEYKVDERVVALTDKGAGSDIDVAIVNGTGTLELGGSTFLVVVNDTNSSSTNITVDMDNDGSIDAGEVPILVTGTGTIELNHTSFDRFVYTSRALDEGIALGTWDDYGTRDSVDSLRVTATTGDVDIASIERCLGANYEQMLAVVGAAADTVMESCFATFTNTYPALIDVGDGEKQQGAFQYGHLFELQEDDDGPDTLGIVAPPEQVRMLVRLTDRRPAITEAAVEMSGPEGGIITDTEESSGYRIIIGGPCVNDAAREILTNPDCSAGFEPGKAIIYETEESLLVAGYDAAETDAAVDVLEHYYEHDLYPQGTTVLVGETVETQPMDIAAFQ